MEYRKFTKEWFNRAVMPRQIDEADRFISLWIAFNSLLRYIHGEDLEDNKLLNKAIDDPGLKAIFDQLKEKNCSFAEDLADLSRYIVANMKNPWDESIYRNYNGGFSSFLRVIYQIRCNLFHGRKSFEDDAEDYALIILALKLLTPICREYFKTKEIL